MDKVASGGAKKVGQDFRVLLVTNAYRPRIGGISRYLSDLVRGLAERGIQSDVFSMPESFNRLDEAAKGSRSWWKTVHLIFVSAFIVRSICRVVALHGKGSQLVVHSHSASFCLFIGSVASLLGLPTVHTFHSPLDRDSRILRFLAVRSDALVFVSNALANLYGSLRIGNRNSVIIPGAVDTSSFRPPEAEERRLARERIIESHFEGKQRSARIVLFVGRLVPEKGLDVLLAAYQEVVEKMPDARLVVVGPSEPSASGRLYLARCIETSNRGLLSGKVAFVGRVSDSELLMEYWAADILVCPSTWPEPAAVVVSEGMACGLPVVASRVGGLHERVDDQMTGLLVPPGNPHALAEGILKILKEPTTRERFSERARLRAVGNLSAEILVERHVQLYRSVIEAGHCP